MVLEPGPRLEFPLTFAAVARNRNAEIKCLASSLHLFILREHLTLSLRPRYSEVDAGDVSTKLRGANEDFVALSAGKLSQFSPLLLLLGQRLLVLFLFSRTRGRCLELDLFAFARAFFQLA